MAQHGKVAGMVGGGAAGTDAAGVTRREGDIRGRFMGLWKPNGLPEGASRGSETVSRVERSHGCVRSRPIA